MSSSSSWEGDNSRPQKDDSLQLPDEMQQKQINSNAIAYSAATGACKRAELRQKVNQMQVSPGFTVHHMIGPEPMRARWEGEWRSRYSGSSGEGRALDILGIGRRLFPGHQASSHLLTFLFWKQYCRTLNHVVIHSMGSPVSLRDVDIKRDRHGLTGIDVEAGDTGAEISYIDPSRRNLQVLQLGDQIWRVSEGPEPLRALPRLPQTPCKKTDFLRRTNGRQTFRITVGRKISHAEASSLFRISVSTSTLPMSQASPLPPPPKYVQVEVSMLSFSGEESFKGTFSGFTRVGDVKAAYKQHVGLSECVCLKLVIGEGVLDDMTPLLTLASDGVVAMTVVNEGLQLSRCYFHQALEHVGVCKEVAYNLPSFLETNGCHWPKIDRFRADISRYVGYYCMTYPMDEQERVSLIQRIEDLFVLLDRCA